MKQAVSFLIIALNEAWECLPSIVASILHFRWPFGGAD